MFSFKWDLQHIKYAKQNSTRDVYLSATHRVWRRLKLLVKLDKLLEKIIFVTKYVLPEKCPTDKLSELNFWIKLPTPGFNAWFCISKYRIGINGLHKFGLLRLLMVSGDSFLKCLPPDTHVWKKSKKTPEA